MVTNNQRSAHERKKKDSIDQNEALIFDFGKFRGEDGPGIRTIIFFKGCPLDCKWCSNPYGINPKREIGYKEKDCIFCKSCIKACPNEAISVKEDEEKIITDRSICTLCGQCTETCPTGARWIIGEYYSPKDIVKIAMEDEIFYQRGGGGLTLSGGEVLMQSEIAKKVLELCQKKYINTAIETSAFAQWSKIEKIIPLCDTIFVDIKHIDTEKHQKLTGVPNEKILDNIRKIAKYSKEHEKPRLIIRIPVIPNLNDTENTMKKTAEFISKLPGKKEINLLPYHRLGQDKYPHIGKTYECEEIEPLNTSSEKMKKYKKIIESNAQDAYCTIGGGKIASSS